MRYNFDEQVDQVVSSVKWGMTEKFFGAKDLIPMWVADMDFKGPQPVVDALKERAEVGVYGYTTRPDSLLEAIKGWLARRHNWNIEQDWICFSPGVIPALTTCVREFTKPGDSIIIQPPVYAPFAKVVKENNRELVTNPLKYVNGRYEMDFDDLKEKIKSSGAKMIILCSPHNPIGRVWTKEELQELTDICMDNDMLIISDEIHADLVFSNNKHIPLSAISDKAADKSVVCMAPSKTFNMAGLQASFIFIQNKEMRDVFNKSMQDAHTTMTNTFAVIASEAAYTSGDEWLDQVLAYIRGNLDYLIEFAQKNLPEVKVVDAEGTYLAWLDCRGLGMSAEEMKSFFLTEAKVALNEGSGFGEEGTGFYRMNLACKRSTLEEGLNRIHKALRSRVAMK
jgi:cystathionine beta-lyase